MTTSHLWGELPEVKSIRTPKMLLNVQASALQEITSGALTCITVAGSDSAGKINIQLRLIAPSLGNYSVALVVIYHEIISYPCTIYSPYIGTSLTTCNDELELQQTLKDILQNAKTRELIANLLTQIKAENSIAA
jgi:hypothetical protein